jgi:hypothetical protein
LASALLIPSSSTNSNQEEKIMSAKASKSNHIIALLTVGLMTFGTACGELSGDPEQDDQLIPQTFAVSECGGFKVTPQSNNSYQPAGYCDAEVLEWTFEPKDGTLRFSNNRVLLNCCGDRKVTLKEVKGKLVINETDAPELSTGARCHCMCVFDLAVEALKVPGGVVQVELHRSITDGTGGPTLVFDGKLDLNKGSGTLVIDKTDVGPWCEK